MSKKVYLGVAIELVAALFFMQPAHAFFGFKSPARVGLRDKISPDVKCPYPKPDWLSGSVLRVKNKNVNSPVAPKGSCTHFELTDPTPSEIPLSAVKGLSVEGLRWQLGTENLVPGGFGPLAAVGGLEPTGRMVVNLGFDYEGEFKVVAIGMDESTNTVTFEAFFRACVPKPHKRKLEWLTCTPFIIPSGITFPMPEGLLFPVDITIGKPMKLPKNIKEAIAAQLKSPTAQGLLRQAKQQAINAGIGAGSSLVTGGFSGGGGSSSGGSSSGSSSAGGYSGSFAGQTMRPVNAPMTSDFGPRTKPCAKCSSFHKGVDFGVPSGTTVLAAADGKIIYQGWINGYGETLIIDHGGGHMSQYSHLSKDGFLSGVGSVVKMGSPVAISGATGVGTGAHLHFAWIENGNGTYNSGVEVNPMRHVR